MRTEKLAQQNHTCLYRWLKPSAHLLLALGICITSTFPGGTAIAQKLEADTMSSLNSADLEQATLPPRPEPLPSNTLQGGVSTLRVTRGRSQIIKFAQPITRVSISDPTLADLVPLAPDQIMINGKQRGVTSLIVWDENGQEGMFDLFVGNDTSELIDAVKALAPNEDVDIRITDDSFILIGKVSSAIIVDEIRKVAAAYGYRDENFINLTESPVPQVALEVRIAEAQRGTIRNLKKGFAVRAKQLAFQQLAQPFVAPSDNTIQAFPNPAALENKDLNGIIVPYGDLGNNDFNNSTGNFFGRFLPTIGNNKQFQTEWEFLETDGRVRTLAEPTLVATHGRTASFLAGGEIPFLSGTDQNGNAIIEFKEFGVKLDFTPWIAMRSGRVELKVSPEVSSQDQSNCLITAAGQVCGLFKRRTETTVELRDGETLLISGILSREEQNNIAKIPFIGDVPILGSFFRNADMSKNEQELVIVVTPHIVGQDDYGKTLSRQALLREGSKGG